MRPFLLLSSALVGCSAGATVEPERTADPSPTGAQTLERLARFAEFSGHLGDGGRLASTREGLRLAPTTRPGGWVALTDSLTITLGRSPVAPTRIARTDDPDAWIELTVEGTTEGVPEVHGAALVVRDVAPATDVVQVAEPGRFEEIRVLRTKAAPTATRTRVAHGPGIVSLRLSGDRVEGLDAAGRVRLASAPAFAIDDHGTRRALSARLAGDVLELSLDPTGLAYPIAVDPLWTAPPDLTAKRYKHGAAPLPGGKAMIAGGWNSSGPTSITGTTFGFDGATKKFTALATMPSSADSFAMTVLSSGKLLVTGGELSSTLNPNRGGDVYDPTTDAWAYVGSTGAPYQADVVAALSGDRALAVSQPTALYWTLATKTFVAAGTTTITHGGHTATTIAGDKVLVVGSATSKVTDIWDPATKTFSAGAPLSVIRSGHTATLLPSGKVLVVGGAGHSSAELYDPTTKAWSAAGAMSTVRTKHTATLLFGDRVLVAGGQDGGSAVLSSAEIYDGATNSWALTEPMTAPRIEHTATALPGARVLVVGGFNGTAILSSTELFEAGANGAACTKANACTSGLCVDGVCCDATCTGKCEACDVAGKEGTCTAVTGAPHGTRTACVAAGTGVCARACDGTDRATCNFGAATVVCAAATCAAGSATASSSCDGAGNCPAPKKTDCAPYACGGTACKTSCATDADCGGANVCDSKSGKCIPAIESKCSGDGLTEIPSDSTKPQKACTPYLCDPSSGKCLTRCASTRDCVTGTACDTTSGECKPTVVDTPDSGGGGCAMGGRGSLGAGGAAALLLAVSRRRRRSAR